MRGKPGSKDTWAWQLSSMLLMFSCYPKLSLENLKGLWIKGKGKGANRCGEGQEKQETLRQKPQKISEGFSRIKFNGCYHLLPLISVNVHHK